MDQINSEILRHFENEGLKINEAIAIDTRLVKSAIRLLRNDEINKLREKKDTSENKHDKNGKSLKFSRDLDNEQDSQKFLKTRSIVGTERRHSILQEA
jgi:hypothetical protein